MNIQPTLFFQLLSDETRLRALMLMQQQGELCVCELTFALNVSQPKISRHLATLRDAAIVSDRRAGQWIYYQLNPELPGWALAVLDDTLTAVTTQNPYREDLKKLSSMPNRPDAKFCA